MDVSWSIHEIFDSVQTDSILFFLKHWDVLIQMEVSWKYQCIPRTNPIRVGHDYSLQVLIPNATLTTIRIRMIHLVFINCKWSRHMKVMNPMKVEGSFVPAILNCEMSREHSLRQFSYRHFVLPQIAIQIARFLSAPAGPHVCPMNPDIRDPFWMQSEAPDIINVMWYTVCNHCVWPNLVRMQQWWL